MGAVLPGEYRRRPPLARPARPAALHSPAGQSRGALGCGCCQSPGAAGDSRGPRPRPVRPACPVVTHRAVGGAGGRREGGWLGGWRASSGQRPVTACGLEARPALSPVGDSRRPKARATFRGDLLTRFSTRLCRGAAQAEEDREGRGGEQPASHERGQEEF